MKKQQMKISFSQFECRIQNQSFLNRQFNRDRIIANLSFSVVRIISYMERRDELEMYAIAYSLCIASTSIAQILNKEQGLERTVYPASFIESQRLPSYAGSPGRKDKRNETAR